MHVTSLSDRLQTSSLWVERVFNLNACSLLSHTSDIDDLLEGLDGVLEYWLYGLHDTKSSFHIINLWLHAFNGLHLSGNLTSGCPSSSLLRILAVRAFWMFLMAAVLATAASPSPLASDERADERVDSRLTRSSSSFIESYWLAAATATRSENFISVDKVL